MKVKCEANQTKLLIEQIKYGLSLGLPVLCYGNQSDQLIRDVFNDKKHMIIDCSEITEYKQLIGGYIFGKDINYRKGLLFSKTDTLIFTNVHEKPSILCFLEPFFEKLDMKIVLTSKVFHRTDFTVSVDAFYSITEDDEKVNVEKIKNEIHKFLLIKENQNIKNRSFFYENIVYRISNLYLKDQDIIKSHARKQLFLEEDFIVSNDETAISVTPSNKTFMRELIDNQIFKNLAPTKPVISTLLNLKTFLGEEVAVILIGNTGTGKTLLIQEFAKVHNRDQLIVLNCSADTEIQDLIGYYKINDKHFEYQKTPLLHCIESGKWILLDEINLCQDHVLKFLEAIVLKKSLYNFDTQQEIKFHKNFKLFAGMNDIGKKYFEGRGFKKIYFDDFLRDEEDTKIVIKHLFKKNHKLSLKYQNDKNTQDCVENEKRVLCNNFIEFFLKFIREPINNNNKQNISGRILSRIILNCEDVVDLCALCDLLLFSKLPEEGVFKGHILLKQQFSVDLRIKQFESSDKFHVDKRTNVNLNRICLALKKDLPILLYGDTSTGKTALVYYLCDAYKKKCYRINNHENTETSDYFGFYTSKCKEKFGFKFQPGTLIKSLNEGATLLLDELNLAPTDILESLNRLLDDNKELYVTELGTIKPHKNFRLIATQNENYSGRKILSTAFRNRFVEIPILTKSVDELTEILIKQKKPKRFIECILNIFVDLQGYRSLNCLITLRDIFKWTDRPNKDLLSLIINGLLLIRERQRSLTDILIVENVFKKQIQKNYKYENICLKTIFNEFINVCFDEIKLKASNFFFTEEHKRLIVCVLNSLENKENVLIVGDTGNGKTKVVELLAKNRNQRLITVNFNGNIEASDFIGQFAVNNSCIEFINGPVVEAMQTGSILLLDELNLCSDSVIERLNSVLDSRSLYLTETNTEIIAHPDFRIVGTMNPGNDFGKRELSPALRNRFTELYFSFSAYEGIFEKFGFDLNVLNEVIRNKHDRAGYGIVSDILLKNNCSIRKIERSARFLNKIRDYKMPLAKKYKLSLEISGLIGTETIDVSNYEFVATPDCIKIGEFMITKDSFFSKTSFEMMSEDQLSKKLKIEGAYNFKTFNCFQLAKAFVLNDAVLLEGPPGVGKTSLIIEIAKYLQLNYLRINLSDATEFSDFVGAVDLKTLKFKSSIFVDIVKNGGIIILDEINLCTQNILEGLNSLLDYRRTININGVEIKNKAKIVATMNPIFKNNNRKALPKSFLDRFIRLKFQYTEREVEKILKSTKYYKLGYSLRDCFKVERLGENLINKLMPLYNTLSSDIYYHSEKKTDEYKKLAVSENKINCKFDFQEVSATTNILIGETQIFVPPSFIFLSTWLWEIEMFFRALYFNIPILIHNTFYTKYLIAVFETNHFYCNSETEISDFIGEYERTTSHVSCVSETHILSKKNDETEENKWFKIFEFKYSDFIRFLQEDKLLVIHFPDKVNPAIFDRLNSIFDNKTFQFFNKEIYVKCRIVLVVDDLSVSPAVLDRCVFIDGNKNVLKFESLKFFGGYVETLYDFQFDKNGEKLFPFRNISITNRDLDEFLNFLHEDETIICCSDMKLKLIETDKRLRKTDSLSNFLNIEQINVLSKKETTDPHYKVYKKICSLGERVEGVFAKKIYCTFDYKLEGILFIIGFYKATDYDFISCSHDIPIDEISPLPKEGEFENTDIRTEKTVQNTELFVQKNAEYSDLEEIKTHKYNARLEEIFEYKLLKPPKFSDVTITKILNVLAVDPLRLKIKHLLKTHISKKVLKNIINIYKYNKRLKDENQSTINFLNKRDLKRKDLEKINKLASRDYSIITSLISNLETEKGQKEIINTTNNEFNEILPVLKTIAYNKLNKKRNGKNYFSEMLKEKPNYTVALSGYKKSLKGKENISNSFSKLLFLKLNKFTKLECIEAEFVLETILILNEDILYKEYLTEECLVEIFKRTKEIISEKYLDFALKRLKDVSEALASTTKFNKKQLILTEQCKKELILKNIIVNPIKNIENYRNFTKMAFISQEVINLQDIEHLILNNSVGGFYETLYFIKNISTKPNQLIGDVPEFYNFSLIYYHLIIKIEKLFTNIGIKKQSRENCVDKCKEEEIISKQHITGFIKDIKLKKHISSQKITCYGTCKSEVTLHLKPKQETGICLCQYLMADKSQFLFTLNNLRKFEFNVFFTRRVLLEEKYNETEILLGVAVFSFLKLGSPQILSSYVNLLIAFPSIPLAIYILKRLEQVEVKDTDMNEAMEDEKEGESNQQSADGDSCSQSDKAEEVSAENEGDFGDGKSNEEDLTASVDEINDIKESAEEEGSNTSEESSLGENGEDTHSSDREKEEEISIDNESETTENSDKETETNSVSDADGVSVEKEDSHEENFENTEGELQKYEYKDFESKNNQGGGTGENYEELDVGLEIGDTGFCRDEESKIEEEQKEETGNPGESENITENLRSLKIQTRAIEIKNLENMKLKLQAVLLDNKTTKYSGGFPTGKKLNIKKIIPFLASNFTQNKIWQRRINKNKKDYKFNIFIDNSFSMKENYGDFITELFKLINEFMNSLFELAIEFEIYKFSDDFEKMERNSNLLNFFDFSGTSTSLNFISEFGDDLNVIFTDGIFQNLNVNSFNSLKTLLIIFDKNESLKYLENVSFVENQIFKTLYLKTLPFKFCLIEEESEIVDIFVQRIGDFFSENF
ncbi:Midasin [Cucumispora dikerogammari]|nr:Midasin [Cucumispora dikerogammari]